MRAFQVKFKSSSESINYFPQSGLYHEENHTQLALSVTLKLAHTLSEENTGHPPAAFGAAAGDDPSGARSDFASSDVVCIDFNSIVQSQPVHHDAAAE